MIYIGHLLKKKHMVCLFYDIKKAYDTTWKQGIIKKLIMWGIHGRLLTFIHNFLIDRVFQVRYRNHLSEPHTQTNGVPQGSVLSPLLFLIAMNDVLSNQPPDIKACIYADDIIVYSMNADLTIIKHTLTESIKSLVEWSNINGFKFSPEKTKAMHFTNLRKFENLPCLVMMSETIKYVSCNKFLGLFFDDKLKWLLHIRQLKEQCLLKLKVLKYLSGVKWGGDRKTMLHLYHALILSKIDYGAEIYGGSCQTYLKMLDSVHTLGVRLATGAFVTSPSISILVEAGEQPLCYRRMKQLTTASLKEKSKPNNAFQTIFDDLTLRQYRKKSIPARLENTIDLIKLKLPPIVKIKNDLPPWATIKSKIFENLFKKDDPPTVILGIIREKFDNPIIIYTDGSVSNQGVGSACIWNENQYLYGLPKGASNFTAEAFAVMKSIKLITKEHKKQNARTNYIIASDSKSTLQALKSENSNHPHIKMIKKFLVQYAEIQISLVWIPSHRNIPGNEAADKAAKSASKLPPTYNSLTLQDASRNIKQKINEVWNQQWQANRENKLREVKYDTTTWPDSERTTRWEEVALCRLRIGHTKTTHEHLLKKEQPPICTGCGWTLTVKHWLTECPSNRDIRKDLPDSLKEILGQNGIQISKCLDIIKGSNFVI